MKFLFYFSGESPALALAELRALFELSGLDFHIREQSARIVIIESKKIDEAQIKKLSERSALLRLSTSFIFSTRADLKWLKKKFEETKWFEFVTSPFCVRILDLTKKYKAKTPSLQAELAGPIWRALKKPSVDLKHPKTTIYVILTKSKFYVTKLIWTEPRGRFKARQPSAKPAFHPTALKPKLARLLVNLARARKGTSLLDPFCGTGSIPLEAALIGCRAIATDIDPRMLARSKRNFDFFKVKGYKLQQVDATLLQEAFPRDSIDAIATDPPYRRASFASGKDLQVLYSKFLKSASIVLKPGAYLSLMIPAHIKPTSIISRQFKCVAAGTWYVHRALTRRIIVLRKR